MRETRTEFIWLKGFYLYSLKEQFAKKIILKCPPDLITCNVNFSVNPDPQEGKYSMVIVPTLKKDTTTPQTSQTDVADLDIPTNPNSKMNLIVWNCRGSNNMEFRRQFRSLLDNYKPALVALLETRMHDHTVLKNDFNFSNLAQVEAQSMSRGMALLWNDDLVHVDELTITSQEIHCMVQAPPGPAAYSHNITSTGRGTWWQMG
uniref:Endonuclease/exonuclease/phosphatase domain-containing protein n=1 Tax=Nicotiana tabacum TaxID=4097 RepID=A0A1S4A2X8_TOBAC|nr:PREDICTED: uncharacterized protein LOC107793238 [Nicotiana tabacum]